MTQEHMPYFTADLPGVCGRLKEVPEDFLVEEIPAYEPSGVGEHLFLWIEKRDISGEQLLQHLSQRLGIPRTDIGMAGLKDRRAVTRQYVSVPVRFEEKLPEVDTEQIRILNATRHGNKLKTGHLRGNRFSLLLRDVAVEALAKAEPIKQRIAALGFPNYFGDQRFGHAGETRDLGFRLLRGEQTERDIPRARRKFLLRLALSSVQSELFNRGLAERMNDGLLDQVLPGDVMQVCASGGVFLVENQVVEEPRFLAGEIVTTGPLFGPKMRQAAGDVLNRELALLEQAGLTAEHFRKFAKLTPGSRRPFLIRPEDLQLSEKPDGLRIEVTLPAGVYATTLLREFQKAESNE